MLNIIVACNLKGVIGKDGKVPWHIPYDLKQFKRTTMGHPIIMGRKTHESIGKILKGRTNIIISRDENYVPLETNEPVYTATSLSSALEMALQIDEEVFVIGGEEIYKTALPFVDRICLTKVYNRCDGDAFFSTEILSLLDGHFDRVNDWDALASYKGWEIGCSGFSEGFKDEPACEFWFLTREKKVRE